MHTIVAISEIKQRAEAIGLTLSAIAAKAGVAASTAQRLAKGKTAGGRVTTHQKMVAALEAEEARVRQHLKAVDAPNGGEAAA